MPKPSTLMTVAEIADRAGIHPRTVRRYLSDGLIEPTMKLPGKSGAYLFDERAYKQLARVIKQRQDEFPTHSHAWGKRS